MKIIVFGLNHVRTPISLREKVTFPADRLPEALTLFKKNVAAQELVILSTCNRSEIYCDLDKEDSTRIIRWVSSYHDVPYSTISDQCYIHTKAQAVKHLFRVGSGLDSMVIGENQILRQLKQAYQTSLSAGATSKTFNRLFQTSFKVAKMIRNATQIGSHSISVAFVAVKIAQQLFKDLSDKTALIVGAGETSTLVMRNLHNKNLKRMIIANRNFERARQLAKKFTGYAIEFNSIPAYLREADIIITSTASQTPIILEDDLQKALKHRKGRPIYCIDLSIPRNIESSVEKMENIYLYTIDDLGHMANQGWMQRINTVCQADEIIAQQGQIFLEWVDTLQTVDTVKQLHQHCNALQQDILREYHNKGMDPEHQKTLSSVTRLLINRLLHQPNKKLTSADPTQAVQLRHAIRTLFDLPEPETHDNKVHRKDEPSPS